MCVHLEKCIDTDKGTLPNLAATKTQENSGTSISPISGGTDIEYTCDYYKHNAEKCDKHGNNADGKCCSCKPAGKTRFLHTINC